MKNLMTITGTPATPAMVAKDVALQIGKIAVVWVAANVVTRLVYKGLENQTRSNIDWNHPAFKTLK